MVIGLVGLVMMAIPAFGRHGHAPGGAHGQLGHGGAGGHALGHGGHVGHAGHVAQVTHAGHAASAASAGHVDAPATGDALTHAPAPGKEIVPAGTSALRFLPSPRAIFSVLALYGAFGNALVQAAQLPFLIA